MYYFFCAKAIVSPFFDGGIRLKSLSYLKNSPLRLYFLLGLIAIEFLMSFSFLGYVHIEPISITFAYIPVLLAGCILDPIASTIVGTAFGLSSMWKASADYVAAGDRIFSPILSGSPLSSFALSVISRALFGLLIGLMYTLAKKSPKHNNILIVIVSLFGRSIHSVIVYCFMGVLFPEMGFGVATALSGMFTPGNTLTSIVSAAIVLFAFCVMKSSFFKQVNQHFLAVENMRVFTKKTVTVTLLTVILTLVSACAIAFYFVYRMSYVLDVNGYDLTETAQYDILHLQTQFLFGIFSLIFLVALILFMANRHTTYVRYEATFDSLTGVLNRNGFFPLCERILSYEEFNGEPMYFVITDIDDFKHINDSYGHPKGDEVLYKFAYMLQKTFSEKSVIGRIGGDEFAVMLYEPLTLEELENLLNDFLESLKCVGSHSISCSIGAVAFREKLDLNTLYELSDECLYKAKSNGKGQYYIK